MDGPHPRPLPRPRLGTPFLAENPHPRLERSHARAGPDDGYERPVLNYSTGLEPEGPVIAP